MFSHSHHTKKHTLTVITLSILAMLLLIKQQTTPVKLLRHILSTSVVPIQLLANAPSSTYHHFTDQLQSQKRLLRENLKLQTKQIILESKLQHLQQVEKENSSLKSLLGSSTQIDEQVKIASILAVKSQPFNQEIVINKGKRDGIYIGQPVLDAFGIMGQVIANNSIVSRVLLLTDPSSAIPVIDQRTQVRAIAVGSGDGEHLSLINIPNTTHVKTGDILVASGLGMTYPTGYPVGKVAQISTTPNSQLLTIQVNLTAHIQQSRLVLLVWPKQRQLANAVNQLYPSPSIANTVKY